MKKIKIDLNLINYLRLCLVFIKFERKCERKKIKRKSGRKEKMKKKMKLINYFYMFHQTHFTSFHPLYKN